MLAIMRVILWSHQVWIYGEGVRVCGGHHVRERVRSVSTSTVTKDTVVMVALATSVISNKKT